MKPRLARIALGLSASLVGVLLAQLPACFGDSFDLHLSADSGPTTTYDCGTPGGSYVSLVPAARPATTSGGVRRWYAFDRLQLGITDRTSGMPDPYAWTEYGFDLDGLDTTACDSASGNHTCKRKSGSPTAILRDGPGGVDNNFGAHFMQSVKSLKSDFETVLDEDLRAGQFSVLLRIDDVPDAASDDATAPGALYFTGRFAGTSPPSFTGDDQWPILDSSLQDGASLEAPVVTFPDGYVVSGVWVSGPPRPGTMLLDLSSGDIPLVFPIDDAIVSVRLADGTGGVIAGAMSEKNLAEQIRPTLAYFGICSGNATYDQVLDTLTMSSDLVLGAPHLQDFTATCDAMSIGLGFTMKPTGAPTRIVPPRPPARDACSMGDAGDAGSSDADGG